MFVFFAEWIVSVCAVFIMAWLLWQVQAHLYNDTFVYTETLIFVPQKSVLHFFQRAVSTEETNCLGYKFESWCGLRGFYVGTSIHLHQISNNSLERISSVKSFLQRFLRTVTKTIKVNFGKGLYSENFQFVRKTTSKCQVSDVFLSRSFNWIV